jgi:molecular chaperone DnaK
MNSDRLLAIDVGTTRTRTAYLTPNTAEPMLVLTPSTRLAWFPTALARSPHGGWLIGDAATTCRLTRPDLYWNEVKRHLGEETPHHLGGHPFTVTEALAQIIGHAAMMARHQAGHGFDRLARAAPVEYAGARLTCLREAAELAGFAAESISVTTEPEAAARTALGARPEDGHWLLFDLGGGTFDAALLRTRSGVVEVLDTVGDDKIGGFLIDDLIVEHLTAGHPLEPSVDDTHRLRRAVFVTDAARTLKHGLSDQGIASVYLPDPPVELELTNRELVEIARPAIATALEHCTRMLQHNELGWPDITGLVTTGAATEAPALRQLLVDSCPRRDSTTPAELSVVLGLLTPQITRSITTAAPRSPRISAESASELDTLRILKNGYGPVSGLQFSPNGDALVSVGSSVDIWDPITGALHLSIDCENSYAAGVAFSPDGLRNRRHVHRRNPRLGRRDRIYSPRARNGVRSSVRRRILSCRLSSRKSGA